MQTRKLARIAVVAIGVAVGFGSSVFEPVTAQSTTPADGVPVFEVDRNWPKLPNGWVMGHPAGVTVDRHGNIWLFQRPRTLDPATTNVAPPVLMFDPDGKFVKGWGGPSPAYDWPDNEHGIYVDHKDRVWLTGSNPSAQVRRYRRGDDMILIFTTEGKFIGQIGSRNMSRGNEDTDNFKGPSDLLVLPKTNELFVADGYFNRRVIVLDAETWAFKRMWGAFGNKPMLLDAAPARSFDGPGPQQFGIVHAIEISNDDLVYIGDRGNSRIQVFSLDGKYLKQAFVTRDAKSAMTTGGLSFSPDPGQKFLYVADQGNHKVHILLRETLEEIGSFGGEGKAPGQFTAPHQLATDLKGNLYTVEVKGGERAQRFLFEGYKPRPAPATR
jgi:DNA-binding beta-propeller fold protein YncE